MCGRYGLEYPREVRDRFDARMVEEINEHQLLIPRFNIAPTQDVLVVARSRAGERIVSAMRWGLVPSYSKDMKSGPLLINLRAETVLDRGHFRGLLERRRCIIPADGFYEWQRNGKERQPWDFHLHERVMFGFAGLYDVWRTENGWLRSCTILTTAPNELVAQLHDRMPVMLPREAEAAWLDEAAHPQDLVELCTPLPAEAMAGLPVVPLVNSVNNEGAELRTPASERDDERQLTLL